MPPLLLKFTTYQHLGWVQIIPKYFEATKHSRETGWFLHPVSSKSLKRMPEFFLVDQERNWVLLGVMGKAHDVRRLSTIEIRLRESCPNLGTFARWYLIPRR